MNETLSFQLLCLFLFDPLSTLDCPDGEVVKVRVSCHNLPFVELIMVCHNNLVWYLREEVFLTFRYYGLQLSAHKELGRAITTGQRCSPICQ